MTSQPTGQQLDDQYRDDVRELLDAEGWCETAENTVVADNGALWAETSDALDSGVDAPDKSWSVAFDSNVPANVIAAVAVVAAGTDPVAEVRRLRAAEAALVTLADRWQELADHGDHAIGHFEGPAAATLDAEVGERGRTYRKAAADVRDVLASGHIPHDLMTTAELGG
jgi:hypothetical protein